MAAVVARSQNRRIGVGVIGNEGMTGLDLVQNADRAANETVVEAAGSALRIDGDKLLAAMQSSTRLREVLLR